MLDFSLISYLYIKTPGVAIQSLILIETESMNFFFLLH